MISANDIVHHRDSIKEYIVDLIDKYDENPDDILTAMLNHVDAEFSDLAERLRHTGVIGNGIDDTKCTCWDLEGLIITNPDCILHDEE